MTRTPLLGSFVGALIATGLFVVVLGARSGPTTSRAKPSDASSKPQRSGVNVRALIISMVAGLVVGAVSGWWSIAVLCVLGGVLLPAMYAERRAQIADRRRVGAVASWVETVRDLLSAASGIDEAITRSAQTLPLSSPIRAEVQALASSASMGGLRVGLQRVEETPDTPGITCFGRNAVVARLWKHHDHGR